MWNDGGLVKDHSNVLAVEVAPIARELLKN